MNKKQSKTVLSRRQFMATAAKAGSAFAGINIITSAALGKGGRAAASERLTVGAMGLSGRGQYIVRAFTQQQDVQVVAVCDVKREQRDGGKNMVDQQYRNQDCKTYIDFREILARNDIDVMVIATGDNWHSQASIMAARAGKDIYCEKPLSVALTESRGVADELRRTGRIFQCGTQRRSLGNFRFAADLALSGKLGRIKELHAEEAGGMEKFNFEILPEEPEPSREDFDWDLWLGPAQWRPFNKKYPTRGYWSNHVDFSGASICEWGSHTVDLCQWANNTDDTGPVEFWKESVKVDGKDVVRHCARYANGAKLIIRTGLRFGSCPVRYEGDEGWVETGDSGQIETYPKSLLGNRGFEGGYPADNHVRAFLDCVKIRKECISNAEVAHRSISVCHVANICKRLDRPIKWDPAKELCVGDEEANRMLSRASREPWYL